MALSLWLFHSMMKLTPSAELMDWIWGCWRMRMGVLRTVVYTGVRDQPWAT